MGKIKVGRTPKLSAIRVVYSKDKDWVTVYSVFTEGDDHEEHIEYSGRETDLRVIMSILGDLTNIAITEEME